MLRHALLALTAAVATAGLCAVPSAADASGGTPYQWTGSGDGHSWGNASNWEPNTGIPGDNAGDSATISPVGGGCTTIDGGPGSPLANLSVTTPTPGACPIKLAGTPISVTGSLIWDGGEIDSPLHLLAGSTSQISGSNAHPDKLAATLDVSGSLALRNLTSTSSLFIVNPQPAVPTGIHVESSGRLMATADAEISTQACCVNPVPLTNDGTLGASGGTLTLAGVAVTQNATVDVESGATMVSDFGTVTSPGSTYTGGGAWRLQDNATAVMSGTQTLGTGFHLELGGSAPDIGAHLGGTFTLAGPGTLTWTGGQLEAALTIAHGATLDAEGVHADNGNRVLDGRDFTQNGAPTVAVVNHGTVKLGGGAVVTTWDAAELDNESDGALVVEPGSGFAASSCCVNPARVVNNGGTVEVPSTSGDATAATVDGVAYRATGGTTSVAPGRSLRLTGGATGLLSGTAVSGGGTLAVATPVAVSGTDSVGASTTVDVQPSGSLDGTATLTGTGAFSWSGGNISGALTVSTGAATVSGTTHKILANVGGGTQTSTLRFTAPTTFPAGTLLDLDRSVMTLAGTTTLRNGVQLSQGRVVNTGRFVVDPGKGGTVTKNFNGSLANTGTVTVRSGSLVLAQGLTQARGTIDVDKGAVLDDSAAGPFVLAGGTLEGSGTFSASVTNQKGVVSPGGGSVGRLTIDGDYTQGSGGRLAIDLDSARAYDLLHVTGHVTLHGQVRAVDAKRFLPAFGSHHQVVTAASASGALSCVATTGGGTRATSTRKAGHWAAKVTSAGLRLTWVKGAKRSC